MDDEVFGKVVLDKQGLFLIFVCPCGEITDNISLNVTEAVWCLLCQKYGYDFNVAPVGAPLNLEPIFIPTLEAPEEHPTVLAPVHLEEIDPNHPFIFVPLNDT